MEDNKLGDLKMVTFQGHDSNIVSMLLLYFEKNSDCILENYEKLINGEETDEKNCIIFTKYTSNIVMEFWDHEKEGYKVVLKYNNRNLPFFKDEEGVDLEVFNKFLTNNIVKDYNFIC